MHYLLTHEKLRWLTYIVQLTNELIFYQTTQLKSIKVSYLKFEISFAVLSKTYLTVKLFQKPSTFPVIVSVSLLKDELFFIDKRVSLIGVVPKKGFWMEMLNSREYHAFAFSAFILHQKFKLNREKTYMNLSTHVYYNASVALLPIAGLYTIKEGS